MSWSNEMCDVRNDVEALQHVVQQNHAELLHEIHAIAAVPAAKPSWWQRHKHGVVRMVVIVVAMLSIVAPIVAWIDDNKKSWTNGLKDVAIGLAGAITVVYMWYIHCYHQSACGDSDPETTTAHGVALPALTPSAPPPLALAPTVASPKTV